MGVKHIVWVVGSQLVYLAELNELFINAFKKEERKTTLNSETTVFKGEDNADPQLSSIPRVPELLLFLNVVVCVKVFIHLSLKQLGYLFLLKIRNKRKNY